MNTYGYVRVSTKEQNEDRQMIAMREFGVADSHISWSVPVVDHRTWRYDETDRWCVALKAAKTEQITALANGCSAISLETGTAKQWPRKSKDILGHCLLTLWKDYVPSTIALYLES